MDAKAWGGESKIDAGDIGTRSKRCVQRRCSSQPVGLRPEHHAGCEHSVQQHHHAGCGSRSQRRWRHVLVLRTTRAASAARVFFQVISFQSLQSPARLRLCLDSLRRPGGSHGVSELVEIISHFAGYLHIFHDIARDRISYDESLAPRPTGDYTTLRPNYDYRVRARRHGDCGGPGAGTDAGRCDAFLPRPSAQAAPWSAGRGFQFLSAFAGSERPAAETAGRRRRR